MSESGDYTPAPYWKGHDFDKARATYDAHVGRSYSDAVTTDKDAKKLVPDEIKTDSSAPVVICLDVTGSMGEWPKTIFSKLPYLEHELKEYLGEDAKISFCAVGDVFSDRFPLQVREFVSGNELANQLKELVIEGGGGGSSCESYDMSAYYYARHCELSDAQKPIFIFIGDEGLYESVDSSSAQKFCNDKIDRNVTTHKIIGELKRKFSVYCIRKPYEPCRGDNRSPRDQAIQEQWEKLLGQDKIAHLPDPNRVVDVIFGILAKEAGRISDFEEELKDRQLKDKGGDKKVEVVMKALNTIHRIDKNKSLKKLPGPKSKSRSKSVSVTRRTGADKGEDSVSLL